MGTLSNGHDGSYFNSCFVMGWISLPFSQGSVKLAMLSLCSKRNIHWTCLWIPMLCLIQDLQEFSPRSHTWHDVRFCKPSNMYIYLLMWEKCLHVAPVFATWNISLHDSHYAVQYLYWLNTLGDHLKRMIILIMQCGTT